jgi:pseudouridine-5'-phosphate glycosidase
LKHKFATITIHVVGRNAFRQKRTINMNLPISEQVKIGEQLGAERIAEALNPVKHQNVTGVNNTGYIIGSIKDASGDVIPTPSSNSSFGTVTNSNFAFSSRQIQIGARRLF